MIVTLYKNCILNDRYYEVFDCKVRKANTPSALEQYLATLDTYEFDVENVYIQQAGSIVLPLEIPTVTFNPLEYNYMKCVNNDNDLITYCFINEVVFGNGVIVVNYKQDVWANWSDKCTIRQGVLCSLNNKAQVDVANLPIELAQNGPIYPYDENQDGTRYYGLVLTIQPHDIVSGSEDESREQWTVAVAYGDSAVSASTNLTLDNLDQIIQTLLENENKKQLCRSSSPTTLYKLPYIDIVNYYIIPKGYASYDTVDHFTLIDTKIWLNLINDETIIQSQNYTPENIPNNIIGVGILGNIIPYNNLASNININLKSYVYGSNYSIILETPGIISDVTKYFEIEPYWAAESDVATIQRKIQYEITRVSGNASIRNTVHDSVYGGISGSLNTMKSFAEGNPGNALMSAISTQANFLSSINKSLDNIYLYYLKTLPQYGNFTPLASNGSAFTIAYYGLTMFCANVSNEEFINNILNTTGYDVQKYINNYDLSLYSNNEHLGEETYCICKFSWLNITGSTSQNVLRTLEAILSKTTKIYYNGTIS